MQSKNFPHLSDTTFPNFSTVDPYRFQNDFDYSTWTVNTTIQMLTVPWDAQYENVVKFEDDAERDAWIDANASEEYTFDTEYVIDNDGTIRLPVPFNVCMRYNYIRVHFPEFPVEYGDASERISDLFYFIIDTQKLSMSSTQLTLELDYWTTFINDIDISYMMLERGHAPLAAAPTPEEFLAAPAANRNLLMADDVNFDDGVAELIRDNGFNFVFNSNVSDMYMLIVSTADLFGDWGTIGTNTMAIPADQWDTGTSVPNYFYAAVKGVDADAFVASMVRFSPQIVETFKAIAFIEKKYLDITQSTPTKTIHDKTVYKITRSTMPRVSGSFLSLSKSKFYMDSKYDKITKLYKSPYSVLEISTGDKTVTINIESLPTGKIDYRVDVNLFWPFLKAEMHLAYINASVPTRPSTATWSNGLTGTSYFIPSGEFQKFLDLEIPTYAIFANEQTYQSWRRWWGNKQRQNDANTSYDNAYYSAMASYDNAIDSADTSYNNGVQSANTNYANTQASTNTSYDNAVLSTNASYDNAIDSADTSYNNAIDSADISYGTAILNADTSYDNAHDAIVAAEQAFYNENSMKQFSKDLANEIREQNSIKAATITRMAQAANFITSQTNLHYNLINQGFGTVQAIAVGTAGGFMAGGPLGAAIGGGGAMLTQTGATLATAVVNQGHLAYIEKLGDVDFTRRFGNLYRSLDPSLDEVYTGYTDVVNNWDGAIGSSSLEGLNNSFLASVDGLNYTADFYDRSVKKENTEVLGFGGQLFQLMYDPGTQTLSPGVTSTSLNGTNTRSKSTAYSNATGAKNLAYSTSLATKTTSSGNALRTKTAALAAAAATKATALSNATASNGAELANLMSTNTVAKTNALRSKNLAVDNASRSKTNSEAAIANANSDAYLDAPHEYGTIANVGHVTARPDGAFGAIKKQSASALSAAGDQMLRYGYYLNQVWDTTELNLMKNFTYWKASDLWISFESSVFSQAQNVIKRIFIDGVTVWRNPAQIESVSIYDNWPEATREARDVVLELADEER